MLFRPSGPDAGGMNDRRIMPGDIMAQGCGFANGALIATVGAGVWTAAAISNGVIRRSGPVGGYVDTTDTAQNILQALAGNADNPDAIQGLVFKTRFYNTVAQVLTLAIGVGVVLGSNTPCAASLWKDYEWTVLCAQDEVTIPSVIMTNGNKILTFTTPIPLSPPVFGGANPLIVPGMSLTGVSLTAGTLVLGLTYGQGTITGVVTDTNSTGTTTNPVTFSPNLRVDGAGAGTI